LLDSTGVAVRSSGVPSKIFTTIMLLMLLLTPWWAVGQSGRIAGLPAWVVYVLAACVVFPVIIGIMIGRSWDSLANHGEGKDVDE